MWFDISIYFTSPELFRNWKGNSKYIFKLWREKQNRVRKELYIMFIILCCKHEETMSEMLFTKRLKIWLVNSICTDAENTDKNKKNLLPIQRKLHKTFTAAIWKTCIMEKHIWSYSTCEVAYSVIWEKVLKFSRCVGAFQSLWFFYKRGNLKFHMKLK